MQLDHGRGDQIFNVVDDQPQSFGRCIRAASCATAPTAAAADAAATLRGRPPLPGRSRSATPGCRCSNAKAKAELGWTPIRRAKSCDGHA